MESVEKRRGRDLVFVGLEELLSLKAAARQFSLSSLKRNNSNTGTHSSHLLARGMEFAESRRYLPGDDVRNIDWRVTARTGKAHTKLFSAEKENHILLAVDMRSNMYFATKGVFKSVQAALMTGYVGWNTAEKGDRIGGVLFDDEALFQSKPAIGKRGLFPFLETMAKWEEAHLAKKEHLKFSKSYMMDEAIMNLKQMAKTGSLVFIISDFRDFSDFAKDMILQIAKSADVFLCFIYDSLEQSFPGRGQYSVTDGALEKQLYVQTKASLDKYAAKFADRWEKVASLGGNGRIHFMECSTECDCLTLLKTR
jgi:uncharacterized protein (DUF58 family)